MTNQERAVEVIWEEQRSGIVKPRDLVEALADAGLLMPNLPTDDTVGMSSGEWSAGFGYEDEEENTYQAHAYTWEPGKIGISAPHIMDTDDAEAVALAILAAVRSDRAHHAEKSTDV